MFQNHKYTDHITCGALRLRWGANFVFVSICTFNLCYVTVNDYVTWVLLADIASADVLS